MVIKPSPHLFALLMVAIAGGTDMSWSLAHAVEPRPAPTSRLQRVARLEAPPVRQTHLTNEKPVAGSNACLALLASDPETASDAAREWARHGGGDDAAQCAALADIALGNTVSGAGSLDALSQHGNAPAAHRAQFADQAMQAWLLAGKPIDALASARRAVALDPLDPELLVDRGRAEVAAGDPAGAVTDLSKVLAMQPANGDALITRASAFRRLERLGEAKADIDAACLLEPDEPSALLERGILRERAGDADGARTDWDRIVSLSPDTHEADMAQQDLALLDAGPSEK
ncbi:MAG: tetratricopeptide repeat protein [Janthinobacterium lividum]